MASISDQGFFLDGPAQLEEWVDFDQFLNLPAAYGDESSALAATNATSPHLVLSQDSEMWAAEPLDFSQSAFSEMIDLDMSQESFFASLSPEMSMNTDINVPIDNSALYSYSPYDSQWDFRQMIEAQAAADQSTASMKEKRREAGIELHLQRLCDAAARDLELYSDSNTSFSSPMWSDYARGSTSPQSASASASPKTPSVSAPAQAAGAGGIEMVLDLNMNAAANLPKKQKPRSQAQKENYIKARKYGACEKHKKQHKRCNCLEKAAAHLGVNNVPLDTSYRQRPRQPSQASLVHVDLRVSDQPGHERQLARPTIPGLGRVQPSSMPNLPRDNTTYERMVGSAVAMSPTRLAEKRVHAVPGERPQFRVFDLSPSANTAGLSLVSASHTKQNNGRSARHDIQQAGSAAFVPVKQSVSIPGGSAQPSMHHASNGSVQANARIASPNKPCKVSPTTSQHIDGVDRRAPTQTAPRLRLTGLSAATELATSTIGRTHSDLARHNLTFTPSLAVWLPREPLDAPRAGVSASAIRLESSQPQASQSSPAVSRGTENRGRPANRRLDQAKDAARTSGRAFFDGVESSMGRFLQEISLSVGASTLCQPARPQSEQLRGLAQAVSTQMGGFLASTLSAVAGIGSSTVSAAHWPEVVVGRFMSFMGSHIMAIRRSFYIPRV
ncbi:hypothetical protein N7539_001711 [Penicillium diatomitis]|uniref:Uncharacterized protein n=1 Tax=Penicillium diatomitis TaxID=2819901 RepID=A0A9W9XI57_9EURO|nr:uncharacterized protein N7539_001711 [Penicillium diatomitis]KAJ5492965.1 hypothetical protein N7539_001711 [Penicillium diatomitis]